MTTQETIDRAERIIAGLQWPTPHSSAHIAQVLADAGLLADPDDAALIELAESLTHQSCPKGVHPDWFINSEHNLRCPWCVRDEARETITRLNRRAQVQEAAINELANGTGKGKSNPVAHEIWERCQESHDRYHDRSCEMAVRLRAERDQALATIQRVRDLHQAGPPYCADPHHDGRLCPCGSIVCESCGDDYPCPTIRALDQEVTE